ncbi:VOC family protein [Nocardioides sp. CER19]|uniref:VOC family protein n=1 Tax=Nocardioides sp. CER19 TaxID=3038538 RepID=UPI00244CB0EC|nr:VOC family protein [Nocardioides sp. CER19]MDH2413848.1 VOC family protein [Nocardioides sp. CER19]
MYLENVVFDATDPQTTGRTWEADLGTETLTDEEAGFETRLSVAGGPELDLCFQRVPDEPAERPRLQLDVRGGELTALRLESADPTRDLAFWQRLTGWEPAASSDVPGLQHPSGRGPVLALVPEKKPKPEAKNRTHLDLRLEVGDDADAVAAWIADRGGRELHFDWGDLPWRHFADPSGNEFCVLPARKG